MWTQKQIFISEYWLQKLLLFLNFKIKFQLYILKKKIVITDFKIVYFITRGKSGALQREFKFNSWGRAETRISVRIEKLLLTGVMNNTFSPPT